jgi:excisionase family DNA binding protein
MRCRLEQRAALWLGLLFPPTDPALFLTAVRAAVFPDNGVFCPQGNHENRRINMQSQSPFLITQEAAELLRVQPRTIQYWERSGRIKALRISGRGVRFKREDVMALISSDPRPRAGVFGRANAQP